MAPSNNKKTPAPLAQWQSDLEQLRAPSKAATPRKRRPAQRNRSKQRNAMPVVISKMTEEKRQAMLSAGRQMSADDRRAIRERVTRTDWANLIHSERALEQEIQTYLAASPDERAFIDYEIQQVINRKYRQRQIAKAQHTRIVLDTMKARAR